MKDLLLHAQVVVKKTNVSILRPTSAARETRLFFPSNQPIKFSILLNDPTLTSLSYNKVKLVLTGCPSFPLRPARPLNPDDPLHEKKNVIIKLLMTGKFKSKFITSRCRYLPVLLWVPSVPGVPSFLAIPGKKLNT